MGQEEKAQSVLPTNEIVCDVEPDIDDLRNSIDVIDEKILQLINRRLILAQKIGGKKKTKRQQGGGQQARE